MDTLGSLIDKLSIANIREWMQEDIKRNLDSTDAEIAEATRKTNVINQYRTDLIDEIDQLLERAVQDGKLPKLYRHGETKDYGKRGP